MHDCSLQKKSTILNQHPFKEPSPSKLSFLIWEVYTFKVLFGGFKFVFNFKCPRYLFDFLRNINDNNYNFQLRSQTQTYRNTNAFLFSETEVNKGSKSSQCTNLGQRMRKQQNPTSIFFCLFYLVYHPVSFGETLWSSSVKVYFYVFLAIAKGSQHIAHKVLKSL